MPLIRKGRGENINIKIRKIRKYFSILFISTYCSCKACLAYILHRVNSTATIIKNALDSKPTLLNCLGYERLTNKQVGYKKIHRSQFIDINVCDKYTEFDPYMKKNCKQIGCDISYG